MSVDAIVDAALAPLMEPLGWQAFAYGLLGLRTLKRLLQFAKERTINTAGDTNGNN